MTWRRYKKNGVIALALFLLALLLIWWASGNPGGAAGFLSVSLTVSGFLGTIFSIFPFPLAEYLFYFLIVWFLFTLVRTVIRVIVRRKPAFFIGWLSRAALSATALLLAFVLLWGMSYYTPPLTERLDLPAVSVTTDRLYRTTLWLRDEMNRRAPRVARDETGETSAGGFAALAPRAGDGFPALHARWPFIPESPRAPKPMTFSGLMSRFGLSGIYVPFTAEPVVNTETLDAHLPFSICHEMAHECGFGPEDEANFVAFLACRGNPDPVYQYSGYHVAFIYCINALENVDPTRAQELRRGLEPGVESDFRVQTEFLRRYEGPLRDFGQSVNDAYLKTTRQPEGVATYGQVVDLLIALYESER